MSDERVIDILIVEDGDEYLENLSRFVIGPRYVQAHNGGEALAALRSSPVDLIYLDMRFDRIPLTDLLGDHEKATRDHNGDAKTAWKHLQDNQGLYILNSFREASFGGKPVILAYDFSREGARFEHLRRLYPRLRWVPDAVTPGEIMNLIREMTAPHGA